jgi:hypothetical protein
MRLERTEEAREIVIVRGVERTATRAGYALPRAETRGSPALVIYETD